MGCRLVRSLPSPTTSLPPIPSPSSRFSPPPFRWKFVGSEGFTPTGAGRSSLAVTAEGTPYLAFVDGANGRKIRVMYYNGVGWWNTGWTGFASLGAADNPSLAVTPGGQPIVAFEDGDKGTVMLFDGRGWMPVGGARFTPGAARSPTLALAADGTPHLAFSDGANGYRGTVMRFNGASWEILGRAGFTDGRRDGGAACMSLALAADGRHVVAYSNRAQGGSVYAMQYDGSGWWAELAGQTPWSQGAVPTWPAAARGMRGGRGWALHSLRGRPGSQAAPPPAPHPRPASPAGMVFPQTLVASAAVHPIFYPLFSQTIPFPPGGWG